ncbi:hypothetical protein HW555_006064 [Spodoptera exigua]|uniref:THAP-type domain-containing protein n=1 Tax=Spodoptera exigua TaxID=7107 RepID=A0A835GIX6_SPOEX|nr:hypothetical protein HW555_006064 [Spodoptera exigua]
MSKSTLDLCMCAYHGLARCSKRLSGREALGPILPQINVFGRQLGVSPSVMGMVTAVLPLLWAAAKPLFGYIVDFWPAHRKLVFMLLITIMTGSYCGLWFLPMPEPKTADTKLLESVYRLNETIFLKQNTNKNNTLLEKYKCHWNCSLAGNFDVYLSDTPFVNTVYIDDEVSNASCSVLSMEFDNLHNGDVMCLPKEDCNLLCYENESDIGGNKTKRSVEDLNRNITSNTDEKKSDNFYMTAAFWAFVILMCVGTVAFNVANCIGDAVCFDVLGPGTILHKFPDPEKELDRFNKWIYAVGGNVLVIDPKSVFKNGRVCHLHFEPKFSTASKRLSKNAVPSLFLSGPDRGSKYGAQRAWGTAGYGLTALLGGWLIDSVSGGKDYKDFTPAFVVALIATAIDLYSCRALTLPSLSSPDDSGKALRDVLKIPKRFGYGTTLTFSLFCYGIRMICISLIQNPWHLVFVEGIMQGPTYALCYSTIVGYAAHVAPEGYSATVQGIVAGMDDGVGFAIGSLVGGQLYSWLGGRGSFRVLAVTAIIGSAIHAILFAIVSRTQKALEATPEAQKMLQERSNAIYNDTVVPLNGEEKFDR